MKINKYLKELGLDWYDLPGNYDGKAHNCGIPEIENSAGADPRNKPDEEGFCEREFWNLDYTLALYIYPRLCYFKEYYAKNSIPYKVYTDNVDVEIAYQKWVEILDKMILAFKHQIKNPEWVLEDSIKAKVNKEVSEGMNLFIEYYNSLWY